MCWERLLFICAFATTGQKMTQSLSLALKGLCSSSQGSLFVSVRIVVCLLWANWISYLPVHDACGSYKSNYLFLTWRYGCQIYSVFGRAFIFTLWNWICTACGYVTFLVWVLPIAANWFSITWTYKSIVISLHNLISNRSSNSHLWARDLLSQYHANC